MRTSFLAFLIIIAAEATCVQGQPPFVVDLPAERKSADENVGEKKPNSVDDSKTPDLFGSGIKGFVENAEAEEEPEKKRHPQRLWVRAEFMLWWIKPASFAALVTTGDFTDSRPGALDSSGTRILFGGNGIDFQDRTGGRFTVGWWLDDERQWGLQAGYFFVRGRAIGHGYTSPGNPVLATPFFNAIAGNQDSSLVSYPGIMSGRIEVDAPSLLQGAEASFDGALMQTERFRLETLIGFRYLNLNEGLHLNAVSQVALADQYVGLLPYNGNTITVNDSFDTRNHFYGGQLGARTEIRRKRWVLEFVTKAALGVSHEVVSVRGFSNIDTQPATSANAGLFAVKSNSGQFSKNTLAIVPEIGVNLKFQLTERIRLFGGYSFVYWSSVARPGDQVSANVNLNQVPTSSTFGTPGGLNFQTPSIHSTSFFAHGANFGFEFRY